MSTHESPLTLEEWKAADARVCEVLSEGVFSHYLSPDDALEQYFGRGVDAPAILNEFAMLSIFQAVVEWAAADCRSTKRSKTLVEHLLSSPDIDPVTTAVLKARKDARLSFFRIGEVEAGRCFAVEDVLTGDKFTAWDAAMSECLRSDLFIPLRLIQLGAWHIPLVAGPIDLAFDVDRTLDRLEAEGVLLTPEGLRRKAERMGRLWVWRHEAASTEPSFANTDGDDLDLISATFEVEDFETVLACFERRDDVFFEPDRGEWVWSRSTGGPADPERRTILARIMSLDTSLLVEVNSQERLECLAEWLEETPGVRFEHATSHPMAVDEYPLDDRLSSNAEAEEPADPERDRELALACALRWPDEIVPSLGNITPREACKTKAGRGRVARMIRTMPPIGTPSGMVEAPREALLAELGIKGG